MDRQEASRRAAQHALLAALRQVYPDPLVELRDRPAEPVSVSSQPPDEQPARSKDRQQAIRRARRRVQALPPIADEPDVAFDFDAWADRWHLYALRDVAPYLRRYWQKQPAAGARFAPVPRVVSTRRIALRITTVLDPDRDTKAAFLAPILARAEEFYDKQVKALSVVPHHRRRQLRQHAEWYLLRHVQSWTFNQIAAATFGKDGGNTDTVRKGIAAFARLLERK